MRRVKAIVVLVAIIISLTLPQLSISAGDSYYNICMEVGDHYNVSPELLQAVIERESQYNPSVVSSYGAVGLMQVVPRWQGERMSRLGVTDLTDPYSNILVGTDLLSHLFKKYQDPYLVLMCYNEGEYGTAVSRYNQGIYSDYAVSIMERVYELEAQHGKHNY